MTRIGLTAIAMVFSLCNLAGAANFSKHLACKNGLAIAGAEGGGGIKLDSFIIMDTTNKKGHLVATRSSIYFCPMSTDQKKGEENWEVRRFRLPTGETFGGFNETKNEVKSSKNQNPILCWERLDTNSRKVLDEDVMGTLKAATANYTGELERIKNKYFNIDAPEVRNPYEAKEASDFKRKFLAALDSCKDLGGKFADAASKAIEKINGPSSRDAVIPRTQEDPSGRK